MPQTWGAYSSLINVNELSEYVRSAAQAMLGFAQLCNAPTGGALGRNKGDTVQYTYYPDVATAGGELDENEEIPSTSVVPIKGTYTIKEYGNAIPWTGKLEDLSRLDPESDFVQALVNDLKKLENTLAFNEFDASYWIYSPNGASSGYVTNNTPIVTCADTMDHGELRNIVKKAEKGLIPKFDGEDYVYVTGVDSTDSIVYDTIVTTAVQQTSGKAALNGEIGRVAGCRLVKDSHKCTQIGGSTSATLALDKGYLVGADAVIKEVALAPEIRAEDKDFGRQVKIAYYFMGAYKKILSQTLHSRENVIKVASA